MATERERLIADPIYETAMNAAQGPAPVYAGTYENQLSDLFDRISNREKFKYDVNADPLYQGYKDKFIQGGKLAMKDTIGQAAALTGGYGNTYGQQVGQQAYDAYLQRLSDVIPELYGMAYGKYQDEGQQLEDMYALVGQQRDDEYGKYRDALGDWNYNQNVARQMEQEEYERQLQAEKTEYQRQMDEYNKRIQEETTAYNRMQDAKANLMALIKASGYQPTNEELAAANMTREAADALRAEYIRATTPVSYGGGGGGGGGGYGGGGYGGYDDYYDDYYYDNTPTSYSGEYERYLREVKTQELGRVPTAGEVGWNDTAKMLNTLGITNNTTTVPKSTTTTTTKTTTPTAKPTTSATSSSKTTTTTATSNATTLGGALKNALNKLLGK